MSDKTNSRKTKPVTTNQVLKSSSRPVRFDFPDDKALVELSGETGISISQLIRMSVAFAVPKFRSGKISLKDFSKAANPQSQNGHGKSKEAVAA